MNRSSSSLLVRAARAAGVAVEQVVEGQPVRQTEHLGLVQGSFQTARGEEGGVVEERPRHARDGDAVVAADFVGRQVAFVEAEAGARASPPRHRDIDRPGPGGTRPQRAAADLWLSTAPGPPASTAAIHLPR